MTLLDALLILALVSVVSLLFFCNEERKCWKDSYNALCDQYQKTQRRCDGLREKLDAAIRCLAHIGSQSQQAYTKIKDQA